MEGGLESSNSSIIKWSAEEAIAGYALTLETLREFITYPFRYARECRHLGLKWPRGLILYGPQGTGKTSLVRAMVQECNAHLTLVSSHLVNKAYIGESEKFLREAFDEAMSHARNGRPSIVFIDEIDVLCPRPDSKQNQSVRVTSQLLKLMDQNKSPAPHVVVIAATNRVDVIDPALRRYGRFSKEIEVTLPDEEGRIQILMLYTKKMPMDCGVDLQTIARSCNGYTGADLEMLCFEALKSGYKNSSETNKSHCDFNVKMEDWKQAMSVVGSSITRGVTVKIPNVTWEDIGGLKDLKKKLQQVVEWPIKRADTFKRLGIPPARGILLHGPPGCSKTTLAKAAANASQASFFSLCGAELFSKYVGEGEAKLRNTFRCARIAAPSIIFFDEADVIAAKRGGKSSNASTVGERLLSTLLTEMDGLEQTKGIIVLAATNRPHAIDEALMRPGRFDKILYVPPPDLESRLEILRVHTRGRNLAEDVDLGWIAEKTELYTGAELKFLCEEAGFVALREDMSASVLCQRHYETALMRKPMLTQADIEPHLSFANGRGRI